MNNTVTKFNLDVLKINPAIETQKVVDFVVDHAGRVLRRKGIVVGLSGGIDSAVMAAISVQALGKENVLGLILPEKESNPVSQQFAEVHAKKLGIEYQIIDITPTVESIVSYSWRDDYIKNLVPEYHPDCRYNITLPSDLLERDSFNFYVLRVALPDGSMKTKRLNLEQFRTITGFASIKIRARMIHLYAHAERLNRMVAGTTNLTEFILGDFCKYGDGGTDIEALAHLYKNQIYQLADHLEIIPEIIEREPSPDTFSLPLKDQDFYFRIPFDKLDYLLYAWLHKVPTSQVAEVLDITEDAVKRSFKDFNSKYQATIHLREMAYGLSDEN
ncbi:MAG: NAD(+) synthase [Planctomycetes bacterium]|nr:NAD(+) synthase [Planctomycetota bacterium]